MATRATSSNRLTTAARIVLGGIFLLSAVNGIFGFIPPPAGGPAGAFLATLGAAGYFFPVLRAVELTAALLLLSGRLVPLALVLLAPLVMNIAAFHLFLAPAGLPVVLVQLTSAGLLAWRHRAHYRPLIGRATAAPMAAPGPARVTPVMARSAMGGGR